MKSSTQSIIEIMITACVLACAVTSCNNLLFRFRPLPAAAVPSPISGVNKSPLIWSPQALLADPSPVPPCGFGVVNTQLANSSGA